MPGAKVLRFIGVVGENTAGRKQTPGMLKKPVMLTMHLVYGHRIRVKQDALKGCGGKKGNHLLSEALIDNRLDAGGICEGDGLFINISVGFDNDMFPDPAKDCRSSPDPEPLSRLSGRFSPE